MFMFFFSYFSQLLYTAPIDPNHRIQMFRKK